MPLCPPGQRTYKQANARPHVGARSLLPLGSHSQGLEVWHSPSYNAKKDSPIGALLIVCPLRSNRRTYNPPTFQEFKCFINGSGNQGKAFLVNGRDQQPQHKAMKCLQRNPLLINTHRALKHYGVPHSFSSHLSFYM